MLEAKISEMNRPSSPTDIAHNAEKAKLPADAKPAEEESDAELIADAKPEEATSENNRYSKETYKAYGKLGGRPKRKIDECLESLPQNLLRWRKAKSEITLPQKVSLAKWCFKILRDHFEHNMSDDFFRHLIDQSKRTKRQLQSAMGNLQKNQDTIKERNLGLGFGRTNKAQGKRFGHLDSKHPIAMFRSKGGGRKLEIRPLSDGVKLWFEEERSHGQFVDKQDLFIEMKSRVIKMHHVLTNKVRHHEPMTHDENSLLEACKLYLTSTHRYHPRCTENIDRRKEQLQRHCGAKILKPQRLVNITLGQEAYRCE